MFNETPTEHLVYPVGFSMCNSIQSKIYLFGRTLRRPYHFFHKKPLEVGCIQEGSCILIKLPGVCLAPYFVRAGFISLLSSAGT